MPTCQRRHYEFFARAIREKRHTFKRLVTNDFELATRLDTLDLMVASMGDFLKVDNPNFDRSKFEEACNGR